MAVAAAAAAGAGLAAAACATAACATRGHRDEKVIAVAAVAGGYGEEVRRVHLMV